MVLLKYKLRSLQTKRNKTMTSVLKLTHWRKEPVNYTGIIEYPSGTLRYYLNGIIHREDGPAIIWNDGTLFYFINDNDITKEVNDWIKENNIPKVWNNSHKLLFKLAFVK